jgi:hypothetical protein
MFWRQGACSRNSNLLGGDTALLVQMVEEWLLDELRRNQVQAGVDSNVHTKLSTFLCLLTASISNLRSKLKSSKRV